MPSKKEARTKIKQGTLMKALVTNAIVIDTAKIVHASVIGTECAASGLLGWSI